MRSIFEHAANLERADRMNHTSFLPVAVLGLEDGYVRTFCVLL